MKSGKLTYRLLFSTLIALLDGVIAASPTFGSLPNCANCLGLRICCDILMMSLHFFGVSSTFPAKNRQHEAVT